jgi:hypothetical protein
MEKVLKLYLYYQTNNTVLHEICSIQTNRVTRQKVDTVLALTYIVLVKIIFMYVCVFFFYVYGYFSRSNNPICAARNRSKKI